MVSHESDVRALLEGRVDASRSKDVDRLMSHYSDDIVYYDVVPPLRFTGHEEVRGNFVRWFDEYDGPISLETRDLTVVSGEEVAFAHMLHLDSGTRKNGLRTAIWVRSSVCCRRSNGRWLITHEHISVPVDPENLRAWFPSDM
ncbi:nuclear transport factor 2 family protein [Streptomyces sp. 5-8]|uniref:Nuclear transport factor 2 family protein n=1 Tax=Streptomyces musisoli TaxID=2802280 RepID=A0ABS1NW83_9ACTN|nr:MULTISPECIES: nuclear transport factor 2 family protein [Streptomyces]MBL1104371.1 nuclear transport factor 2 family protein [Streptomyces musisoli]MBY8840344.1 nuclear transport factor 2 family protein [Streptomyces sp. SP2-10]